MNRHNIYIVASIIIGILIMALLGWAIFVSKQEEYYDTKQGQVSQFSDSYGDINIPVTYNKEMFGKALSTTSSTTQESAWISGIKEQERVTDLTQIYATPVSGFSLVIKNDVERLRLSEMTTGHIFDIKIFPDVKINRVMQTTIPRTQYAFFDITGNWVVRQYIDTSNIIKTIYNRVVIQSSKKVDDTPTAIQDVGKGIFIEDGISSITYNAFADKIFYIRTSETGAHGILATADGTDSNEIWTSPLNGWQADFVNDATVALSQNAGNGLDGIVYLLNLETKEVTTAFDSLSGVLALFNKDISYAVYSTFDKNNVKMRIRSFPQITDIDIALPTIPEKCVWSVKESYVLFCSVPTELLAYEYPDAWYQGKVHFKDSLWKIDAKTGVTEEIVAFDGRFNVELDGIDLTLDEDESHLFLKNKIDQTLWMVTMPEENIEKEVTSTTVDVDVHSGTSTSQASTTLY